MTGHSLDEYRAPLFLAWQLTNRCDAQCIACCEESGPDRAWRDELRRDEALDLARRVGEFGIPYAARRAARRPGSRTAMGVRAHPVQPARDRRGLRSRRGARLRRVRHRPADVAIALQWGRALRRECRSSRA